MLEQGALFCLDPNMLSRQKLRGDLTASDYTISDTLAMPCHSKETTLGASEDYIREDCIRDPEAVYEYLDNVSTVFWYNYGSFKHSSFDKNDRVVKRSRLLKYRTDERKNVWRGAQVHISQIQDEIDYLQYG